MAHRALTTSRRLYLCVYDVVSDKDGDRRRARLFDLLCDHGEHVQYSVFLCELTPREQVRLVSEARAILHEAEDQLLVMDIGPESFDWAARLQCLGKTWTPRVRSSII